MQHPGLSLVEAYWEGLREGRLVPRRADVDPRGIDQALEFAFILERIAPGMARFRLAGMHLNDLMGMEVRGMPLTSFFVPDARPMISETLEHVFEEPATARLTLAGERGLGKPELEAELLLLPLKSDLGDISRVLGCLVARGDIGRTPRRFSVTETRRNPLLQAAIEDHVDMRPEPPLRNTEPTLSEARPLSLNEPHVPFEHEQMHVPTTRLPAERPYLKLVRKADD
ncbi:MAG: PAS domain-containing protein [Rhodobacteraceae bacterium]|nr:PAS domain-containing protein [Paracoccaceae bacterium]